MKKIFSKSFLSGFVSGALLTIIVMGGVIVLGLHDRFEHEWQRGSGGESDSKPSYSASIRVDDTKDLSDAEDCALIAPLVKITAAQAGKTAQVSKPGEIQSTILENDGGNVVYSIILGSTGKEYEVKVDAGNAKVLQISSLQDDGNESESEGR